MQIPHDELSPPALQAVIEEFVTREGTEYGLDEVDLQVKVRAVRAQLERGEAVIVFDADRDSISIVPTS